MKENGENRLARRDVMRYFAGAGIFLAAGGVEVLSAQGSPGAKGYGTDPDLTKLYKPGDVWPLTMTPTPRRPPVPWAT